MEQLQLRSAELNDYIKECNIMSPNLSERQQAIEANHLHNLKIKQLVDGFFQLLAPEDRAKKYRWTMATDYLNNHPDGVAGRSKPWTPQGLARVYRLSEMWQRRKASPLMVTPARKKIFLVIVQLLDDNASWSDIADALNRRGFRWNPKGRELQPFTHKSANDFYRHHRGLWPHRPRKGSKAQQSLQQLTIDTPVQSSLDAPPAPIAAQLSEPDQDNLRDQLPFKDPEPQPDETTGVTVHGNSVTLTFKRVNKTTSIEVESTEQGDKVEVVIRYSNKGNVTEAKRFSALVHQIQLGNY